MTRVLSTINWIRHISADYTGAFIVFFFGALLFFIPTLSLAGGMLEGAPIINRIAISICLALIVGQVAMWYKLMRYW